MDATFKPKLSTICLYANARSTELLQANNSAAKVDLQTFLIFFDLYSMRFCFLAHGMQRGASPPREIRSPQRFRSPLVYICPSPQYYQRQIQNT